MHTYLTMKIDIMLCVVLQSVVMPKVVAKRKILSSGLYYKSFMIMNLQSQITTHFGHNLRS
jgi:hypothetical protein